MAENIWQPLSNACFQSTRKYEEEEVEQEVREAKEDDQQWVAAEAFVNNMCAGGEDEEEKERKEGKEEKGETREEKRKEVSLVTSAPLWGDIPVSEDGDNDGDGDGEQEGTIKTVIEYRQHPVTKKKMKITRTIRVTVRKVRMNKQVLARKKWAKFGDCVGLPSGVVFFLFSCHWFVVLFIGPEAGITMVDSVSMTLDLKQGGTNQSTPTPPPPSSSSSAKSPGTLSASSICRHCGLTGHFSFYCPQRKSSLSSQAPATTTPAVAKTLPASTSKYIPLHLRDDSQSSLRVNNVNEETTEKDLRDLFGVFGRIANIFIAKVCFLPYFFFLLSHLLFF